MIYDLIIIGTGAAGYSAAIYASRYKLNTLVIGSALGGTATNAHKIENWPGEIYISGTELLKKFAEHVKHFQTPIKNELVKKISKNKSGFEVITENNKYLGKAIILALGTGRRKLDIPGEKKFLGKGVSYCATCDAFFYQNKTVAVVGGGNAATMAAIQLADLAKKVYLIHRGKDFRAEPFQLDIIQKNNKIITIKNNSIKEILGENQVHTIKLTNLYQNQQQLAVDGIFIEVGSLPNSALVTTLGVNITDKGFIKTKENQETNVSGIFAAGDITTNSAGFAQILTAASEGAIASFSAYKYLKKKN